MAFHRFEEIDAWQQARELTKQVYAATGGWKDFALRDQIRRSWVSVMANVAEGFGRATDGDFARFLEIAQGSALQRACHLYVASDLGYLDRDAFDRLYEQTVGLNKRIGALAKYLKQSRRTSRRLRPSTGDQHPTKDQRLRTSQGLCP